MSYKPGKDSVKCYYTRAEMEGLGGHILRLTWIAICKPCSAKITLAIKELDIVQTIPSLQSSPEANCREAGSYGCKLGKRRVWLATVVHDLLPMVFVAMGRLIDF